MAMKKNKGQKNMQKENSFFQNKNYKKKMQEQQTNLDGYRFKNNEQLSTFPRQEA